MNRFMLREDSITEGADGGASKTPPAAESKEAAPAEAAGPVTDDLGYAITPEVKPEGEKAPEPKKEEPKAPEEIKDPATGYGKEAPKAPKEEAAPPPESPKIELGYELEVKDVDPAVLTKVQEFAKANALPKEAAQALLNLRKTEFDAAKQAQADQEKAYLKQVQDTRSAWDKELRTDATFGGEKFAHNVMQAEKVLGDFMPNTKKILTERGSMLPPYVMRDLAKLAEKLYSPENIVQGERPAGDEVVVSKVDEHLDFYS